MATRSKLFKIFSHGKATGEDSVSADRGQATPILKRTNARLQKGQRRNLNHVEDDAARTLDAHFVLDLWTERDRPRPWMAQESLQDFNVANPRERDLFRTPISHLAPGKGNVSSKPASEGLWEVKTRHKTKFAMEEGQFQGVAATTSRLSLGTTRNPVTRPRTTSRKTLYLAPLVPGLTRNDSSFFDAKIDMDEEPEGSQAISGVHSESPLSETDPYEDTLQSQESWAIPGAWKDDCLDDEKLQRPSEAFSNPFPGGNLPAIRDLDWSKVREDEVQFIAEAYNKLHTGYGQDISPSDSAVAFPEDDTEKRYTGKGKERAVCEPPLQTVACLREDVEDQRSAEQEHARLIQEELQREEDERLAAELARLRECHVCGDTKDPLEFPAMLPTERCEHSATTCTECLQSWMASEFETKGCEGVLCPECPETMDYAEVQRAASIETFEAFDKMTTRNALAALDEFAWCLGANCTSGQLNVENSNYMECVSCKYKQCLEHKVPWHVGETCTQYEYRVSGQKSRDEEKATEAMIDSVSKKCPGKSCGWRIQKTDGCDHMKCKRCKHEFCWQCLAAQSEIKRVGNTAHAPTCKFHSRNLDVAWPFNAH